MGADVIFDWQTVNKPSHPKVSEGKQSVKENRQGCLSRSIKAIFKLF